MNYATIKKHDIANGPGVRVSLFVSGCNHHCPGCFNEAAWDFNYGQPFTDDTIQEILDALAPDYIKGLTFLGGEPLEFVCGAGMMIRGFDQAVANMEVGQVLDVHLMPAEAYGEADPDQIFSVNIKDLPGAESVEAGQQVYLQNAYGQPIPVLVAAKDETTITFDANHPMAGKELNFRIELVEVQED